MKINKYILSIILFTTALFTGLPVFAEGSKTLYPDGATGRRAYLRSATSGNLQSWPFPNNGTHYVYAKSGEIIAMASSAQGSEVGSGNNAAQRRWNNRERIELYGPNGGKINIVTYTGTNQNDATYYGNIPDRTAEKAGPRFMGQSAGGNRYEAIYHQVTEEGIYRVQFFSPGSGTSGNTGLADANWSQPNSDNIAAWDVSVINDNNNGFLDGRVYTNVLNMAVQSSTTDGFSGIIYALTKDGYIYKVHNNGNNGIWFTFFVNNNGFVDPASSTDFNERTPLYKSLNNTTNISSSVHNPNNADVGSHITHKLFYNDPRINLSEQDDPNTTFTGAVPGGSTWLRNKPITPDVSEPVIIGIDGVPGQVSNKGGIIKFDAEVQGNYRIEIISDVPAGGTPTFTKRVLVGQAKVGENSVFWDGKDGTPDNLGGPQPLPGGEHPVKVTVQLQGAEVHFPFFDMEMNINGTIIELLNAPTGTSDADRHRVYWDDSDITIASGSNGNGAASSPRNNTHLEDRFDSGKPAGYNGDGNGLDSRYNGHKWGSGITTANQGFGNEKSIDTWAFIMGEKKSSQTEVKVKIADLYIDSVSPSSGPIGIGDEVTYTVVAGNKPGNSDVTGAPFSFILPPGFVYEGNPVNITFTSDCSGTQSVPVTYDFSTNTFNSKLDLPSGCEVTYTFKVKVTSAATSANTTATATIMRPSDVTDPDATNTSDPSKPVNTDPVTGTTLLDPEKYYHPTNPFFEVNNNGKDGESNNIKNNQITGFIDDIRADNDINQTPVNVPVSGNVLTNDYSSNGILNVGSAKYYDSNGTLQDLTLGTATTIYTENGSTEAGTITLNSDGSYTFTPAAGFLGDVPIEYTATNTTNSDDARLTITVIPATVPGNNPPVAKDDVATTEKGTTLTGTILNNDSDPDGDPLTVTGATQGSSTTINVGTSTQVSGKDVDGNDVTNAGSITINANGSYTFVPNGNFVGTVDPIEYSISDGKGGTDKANIYITVIEDNGNTTFANDDANSAPKGTTMTGNVLTNDFDPEGNTQTLTSVTIDGVTTTIDQNDKEITISGKGTLTISPDGDYTFTPEPNFEGTVVVEQTVCDNGTPVACDNATLYLTTLPESDNSTNAVDDFFETKNNTSISGNVLGNDFDNEGDTQKVTTLGPITTTEGGTVTIDENGNFTYTPPADKHGIFDTFTYTVCDNGTPQVCDNAVVTIAVGICYEEVQGKTFNWTETSGSVVTKEITQPTANYGFTFDIYELDNSFNMEINGVQLAVNEIEFQSNGTSGINIMFADGDKYEVNTSHNSSNGAAIWQMRGNAANPLIRVVISHTGKVSMYGSKVSYGPLFPLKFIEEKGNKFNNINFSNDSNVDNTIVVTQSIVGTTIMDGYGYGRNMVDCPNYWHGTNDSEWAQNSNWTDNYVPAEGEDIEFATTDNNSVAIHGISGLSAGQGAAKKDLHLDNVNHSGSGGRIIGDLINKSDKNLVVTTENQLTINGKVRDGNTGIIVVKADSLKASGTLLFKDPSNNPNVNAKVEFYNKAFTCPNCGFYRKQWQYFGIPVQSASFPYLTPQVETINKWMEPTNGNKWVALNPANTPLDPFMGYEINNSNTTKPTNIYEFAGTLNVGNANIALTKTANVNYSGMNLIANSFTAAIPISADAISYSDNSWDGNVYLFNAGTRDQWRKLNGGTIVHDTQSGQYKSVPLKLAGQAGLEDRIPSMHTFMVNAPSTGTMTLVYDKLTKNGLVDGMAWRSADNNGKRELPYIVLDVIGEGSADRVWLFEEASATRGFDNGWDGYKILEEGLIQTYVSGSDQNKYQVATVPQIEGTSLGVSANTNESYTISVAATADVEGRRLYLHDTFTGRGYLLKNGAEIVISGTRSANQNRFKITASAMAASQDGVIESQINTYVRDNVIVVENHSNESATVSVYDISGRYVGKAHVGKDEIKSFAELSVGSGVRVVKVVNDSKSVNKSDRVLLK